MKFARHLFGAEAAEPPSRETIITAYGALMERSPHLQSIKATIAAR